MLTMGTATTRPTFVIPFWIEPPIWIPHRAEQQCGCCHAGEVHDPISAGCTHAYNSRVVCSCFTFHR